MTTATPPRRRSPLDVLATPPVRDVRLPDRLARLPRRALVGATLVILLVVSALLRTREIGGQLWFEEAIASGLASHSLSQLPGVLRNAGSSPLYYVLLHFWQDGFGTSESALRALSLLFSLLCIPLGWWAGDVLSGPRAGFYMAVLMAFSSFLTKYAEQAQPYTLLMALGLPAAVGFVQGLVYRRRRWLWLFVIGLTAALYTQASAGLLAFGCVAALAVVARATPSGAERSRVLRDGALCFAAVFVLYLPWLPTTLHQLAHATSPWQYAPVLGATVPSSLLGGERVNAALLVAFVVGAAPLALASGRRRSPEAVTLWALFAMAFAGLALAKLAEPITASWVARYFGTLVAPLLLVSGLSAARARIVGFAALVLVVAFCANPSTFAPGHMSDMRDIAGELGGNLHVGDVVAVAQPEQAPLAAYYLPAGLRYVSTLGALRDPLAVDWSDALSRLRAAGADGSDPSLRSVIATLRPGQQLLFVRPLTEGAENWQAAWTKLVRRRSAQWGQLLNDDVANRTLTQIAWAPHAYRGSCCVASSAVLYRKASQ